MTSNWTAADQRKRSNKSCEKWKNVFLQMHYICGYLLFQQKFKQKTNPDDANGKNNTAFK